jgi:ribose transport system ATP-binding protein
VTAGAAADRAIALSARSLSKVYSGTVALDALDLDVRAGEIHALLGGNGSGKSTAIKILAGVVTAEPGGRIETGGQAGRADQWSPALAHAAGLRFVHQQPAVFRELTIAENLALGEGFPTGPGRRIKWSALNRRTAELLERYHIAATPTMPLGALAAVDRSRVAIIRALQDRDEADSGVLVLDEPTAALDAETEHALFERYAASARNRDGRRDSITILVSHRFSTVRMADLIVVLDGSRLAEVGSHEELMARHGQYSELYNIQAAAYR